MMYSPVAHAIALFLISLNLKPVSGCQTCIIGIDVCFLNKSMTVFVSIFDPSSAITISSGNLVWHNADFKHKCR